MPRKKRATRRKENVFEQDVDTSVVEVDTEQIRKETFLRDFDLQVQKAVATMDSDVKKLQSHVGMIMTSYIVAMPESIKKMTIEDFVACGGNFENLTFPEVSTIVEKEILKKRLPLTEKSNKTAETPQLQPQKLRSKRLAASKANTAIMTTTRVTRNMARSQTAAAMKENNFITPMCAPRNIPLTTSRKIKRGEAIFLFSHNNSPLEAAEENMNPRPNLDYIQQVVETNSPGYIEKIQKMIDQKMEAVGKTVPLKKK